MLRVFLVSCATGAGIDELRRALFELCPPEAEALPVEEGAEELAEFLVYRPQPSAARASGSCAPIAGSASPARRPRRDELEQALRAAGARKGVEVEVGDEMLVFE